MNDIARMPSTEWHGCYDDGWQGEIVAEAFALPAKVSRALIRRIYQHAFVEGWLLPGDTVVDPFGGIAGTALDAMWNGLTWVGCELEPKFVGLAGENIEQWQRRYGAKAGFGSARIVQGDSRKLADVIAGAHCCIGSPPFAECDLHTSASSCATGKPSRADGTSGGRAKGDYVRGESPGQLGRMFEGTPPALICSSPPYAAIATGAGGLNTKPGADGQQSGRNASAPSQNTDQRYGETAGQLAAMREGEAPAIDCIVSSPPFASQQTGGGIAAANGINGNVRTGQNCGYQNQAESDGNLGAMPEGRFDAVVSSPPYEGQQVGTGKDGRTGWRGYTDIGGGTSAKAEQLSAMEPDTFWSAAREIVAQCHTILRPGGKAIWITKDFVRKGKRVPFSDQWQALCESQGFRLVCRHRAMLVKRHGEQDTIFGDVEQITTERKSFFRRLAEKKGSPAIDWEDVICLERVTA